MRTRTKTRYRLVRGELHGEEGSGGWETKNVGCLLSFLGLRCEDDNRQIDNKKTCTGARSSR